MKRTITIDLLEKILEEKKEFYLQWLNLQIITKSEYDQALLTMESIARVARFHSTTDETLEKDIA